MNILLDVVCSLVQLCVLQFFKVTIYAFRPQDNHVTARRECNNGVDLFQVFIFMEAWFISDIIQVDKGESVGDSEPW